MVEDAAPGVVILPRVMDSRDIEINAR